jgi:hypothetical protein
VIGYLLSDPSPHSMIHTQDSGILVNKSEIDYIDIESVSPGNHTGNIRRFIWDTQETVVIKEEIVADEVVDVESKVVSTETTPIPSTALIISNKVNDKFQSFREKFLDLETQANHWESQIIEKQAKRVEFYKTFASVLDKENSEFDEFKKDKIG